MFETIKVIMIVVWILFMIGGAFYYLYQSGKTINQLKKDKDRYKTGVWLAAGKVQRGKSVKQVLWALECYLPEEDKKQFKKLFAEK